MSSHVHFADDSEGSVPRVHFPDEHSGAHDAEIVIENVGNDRIEAHLGFLQIHHRYQISLSIKDCLGEDISSDPLQNLHVSLMEAVPRDDGEGHDVLLSFKAHKEKLLREQLVLADVNNASKTVTLTLHARVLGKGKGTPALRRGIHCVGVDLDEDSEQSDWQGF